MPEFEYTVKRTKRKSIAIIVTKKGEVVVRAPYVLTDEFIAGYVDTKREWVKKHLDKIRMILEAQARHTAETVRFLGKQYPVLEENREDACFDGKRVHTPRGEGKKAALIKWYRSEAAEILSERVAVFEEEMGVEAAAVKVSNATTRWGSCSSKGNLNFSWKLMMAGGREIDYVVVHELAHLKHMDHSKDFWKEVGTVLPHYKEAEDTLKELSEKRKEENWGK